MLEQMRQLIGDFERIIFVEEVHVEWALHGDKCIVSAYDSGAARMKRFQSSRRSNAILVEPLAPALAACSIAAR